MKVCTSKVPRESLLEWGIEVPLSTERSFEIADYLKKKFGDQSVESIKSNLLGKEELIGVHDKEFVEDLFNREKVSAQIIKSYELVNQDGTYNRYNPDNQSIHFYELFLNQLKEASETCSAVEKSFKDNQNVFYLGGGMHHAMSFGGRGFCVLNDIVLSCKRLQNKYNVKNIWVIDVDAHKGDGTAQLAQNDQTITTLSIHMARGWPLDMAGSGPWKIPSDIDIPIEEGEESVYLDKLEEGFKQLEQKSPNPEFILVVDGSDPYEKDELKSSSLLNLSKEQLLRRDQMTFNFAHRFSCPQTWVMAGGYGKHSWEIYAQFLETFY